MFDKMKMSSIKESMLTDLLVATTHQRVLSLFLAHPQQHFYGAEISKKTDISAGQTSKILNELREAGLLERERKGKTELYRIAVDSPALRTYKVLNTIISITPLVDDLKKVSRRILLYGSCAKGTNLEDSDLDLLVVSSSREKVLEIISGFPAERYYGFSEIRPVIKTTVEWAGIETREPVFYNELVKGVVLHEKEIDESRL